MAFIKCGECGTQISDSAKSCTVCGWVNIDNDPAVLQMRYEHPIHQYEQFRRDSADALAIRRFWIIIAFMFLMFAGCLGFGFYLERLINPPFVPLPNLKQH